MPPQGTGETLLAVPMCTIPKAQLGLAGSYRAADDKETLDGTRETAGELLSIAMLL